MPTNRNYKNGADKERKIVKQAREMGKLAFRSAGSHSPIDVFILDREHHFIELIQSKPKSMSDNKKDELIKSLQIYDGTYEVKVIVK